MSAWRSNHSNTRVVIGRTNRLEIRVTTRTPFRYHPVTAGGDRSVKPARRRVVSSRHRLRHREPRHQVRMQVDLEGWRSAASRCRCDPPGRRQRDRTNDPWITPGVAAVTPRSRVGHRVFVGLDVSQSDVCGPVRALKVRLHESGRILFLHVEPVLVIGTQRRVTLAPCLDRC